MQYLTDLVDTRCIALFASRFKSAGRTISVNVPMVLIASRLRDDIHHAAFGLAILWLESSRLYLHLFYKRGGNPSAQAAIRTREGSDSPERGIGNVYAV